MVILSELIHFLVSRHDKNFTPKHANISIYRLGSGFIQIANEGQIDYLNINLAFVME